MSRLILHYRNLEWRFNMDDELRHACLVKSRRLLLLLGVVLEMVLLAQYFEIPYSNISSSLFVPEKLQPTDNFTGINSRNSTRFSSLNSSVLNVSDEVSGRVNFLDTNTRNLPNFKDGLRHENNQTSDDTVNDDFDLEDEAAIDELVEMNRSENVIRSTSFESGKTSDNVVESRKSESASATSVLPGNEKVEEVNQTSEEKGNNVANPEMPISGLPSVIPSHNQSPKNREGSSSGYVNSSSLVTSVSKNAESVPQNNKKVKNTKGGSNESPPAVVTISEMNDMQLHSHVSYNASKPQWSSPADQELLNVRSLIENASDVENDPNFDVSMYRNFSEFRRSYELMEKTLKVYIYLEGKQPIFHRPTLKGIYASEGWFMKHLKANRRFVTKNPKNAHLFYLPFITRALALTLYVPDSHDREPLIDVLRNYIELIRTKYHFWNRTGGSDHFLVACHDWAPFETRETMPNCIRSLCNSDIREGFQFGKDASLPETTIRTPQNPLRQLGGKPPSQRRILAFFAGRMHGNVRPILLNYWENEDPDMKIFGVMRKVKGQMSYAQYMKSSKYCICAKGFEVNSPRVVEAIFYECVPVIISDYFVPPFFETLNWESFAVFVLEKDIPNLKKILMSIPQKRYEEMQKRVKQVQVHFLWHSKPVKYDIFHMILHSVWYNRVFQARHW